MSAENTPVETDETSPLPQAISPEKDYFLQNLVDNTNKYPENNIGVILQMKGLLVSGTIIPGDTYFNKIADALGGPEDVRKSMAALGNHYSEDREKDEVSYRETTFIHLEDCIIQASARMDIPLWRGRISEVDGFMIGRITKP